MATKRHRAAQMVVGTLLVGTLPASANVYGATSGRRVSELRERATVQFSIASGELSGPTRDGLRAGGIQAVFPIGAPVSVGEAAYGLSVVPVPPPLAAGSDARGGGSQDDGVVSPAVGSYLASAAVEHQLAADACPAEVRAIIESESPTDDRGAATFAVLAADEQSHVVRQGGRIAIKGTTWVVQSVSSDRVILRNGDLQHDCRLPSTR